MIEESATPPAPESVDQQTEWVMNKLDAEQADPASEPEVKTTENDTDGAPTDEAKTDVTEPEPSATFKVKVRGEEQEVTLDELLHGYSRTEDYKVKTAEAAELRRQAQAEKESAAQERQRYLASVTQTLEMARTLDPVIAEAMNTDWAKLANEDPATYVQKQAAYQQRVAQISHLADQQRLLQEQSHRDLLAREHQHLTEKLPEWGDDAKRPEVHKQISSYLESVGFSKDEVNAIADHRALLVSLEAAKYREMIAAQKAMAQKKEAPKPTKVQTPNSSEKRTNPNLAAMKKQALRSGRVDDQVNAILSIIGDG